MRALAVVLVMAGMTAAGHVALTMARLQPRLSPAGDLVLSFLVGAGVTTLIGFWTSLAVPSAGLTMSLGVLVASVVTCFVTLVKRLHNEPHWSLRLTAVTPWVYALVLLLLCDGGLVVYAVLHSNPGWDGLFVWGIKARYFAEVGGIPTGFFSDLSRQWSHLEYPFLLPLTEALVYRVLGTPYEQADMVLTCGYLVFLLLLLHELIRRVEGPTVAVLCTLLLVTVPAFWNNTTQAYAELPLALFLLGGAGFVYRWFDDDRRLQDLLLGGLLLALAIWVKRDGLIVWTVGATAVLICSMTTAIRQRKISFGPVLVYLAPALVLVPWWIDVYSHQLFDQDYARNTVPWLIEHADRMPVLFQTLGKKLLLTSSWSFLWVLIGATALLRPPIHSAGRAFLLGAVGMHLLSLIPIYTLSTWDPYMSHVGVSIDRVMFEVLPLGLLFLATGVVVGWAPALGALLRSTWPVGSTRRGAVTEAAHSARSIRRSRAKESSDLCHPARPSASSKP